MVIKKLFLSFLIFVFATIVLSAQIINISVNPKKVNLGDTVKIKIEINENEKPSAQILIPQKGTIPLELKSQDSSVYTSEFIINEKSTQGLYAIYAWIGNKENPSSIGKGSFLYKKIVGDFCVIRVFDQQDLKDDINEYLKEFKNFGGNLLIAHGIITPKIVYYDSKICNTDSSSETEKTYLETLLGLADEQGIPVLLSTSWDMTKNIHSKYRTENTKKIIEELYKKFSHHPSMVGFYTYQEGSGTYLLPFVREFTGYCKNLNEGLLTACAPYMDDPLLAGYLSTVKNLDIIIYQSMVMASYRPDNRKHFPLRRVKDFGLVNVGAKKLQDKISLTHVETFGYGKNKIENLYITGYENIYQQILSAASVPDNDGITFFTYSSVIYDLLKKYPQYKKEFEPAKQAVIDGMNAFQLIDDASKKSNQLALYFPWADWTIERWNNNYYPALDAFRILGIPVDVLPYAPPLEESYLPYYPYNENPDVLKRLLKEKKILIFPDVTGFYKTDSDMIKHFIENGGTVVAFGPEIPTGTSYDRSEIFGIEENDSIKIHTEIFEKNSSNNKKWNIEEIKIPGWKNISAKILAEFEDGSPAITINKYGKGKAISILTDVNTAAKNFPGLIRNIFNEIGAARYIDIIGTNENTDAAVSQTKNGFKVAVINHNNFELNITLKPLLNFSSDNSEWIDLSSDEKIQGSKNSLTITISPKSFKIIEYRGAY